MGGWVGRAVGEEVEMSAVEEPASCRHLSAFSLLFGIHKPREKSDHRLVDRLHIFNDSFKNLYNIRSQCSGSGSFGPPISGSVSQRYESGSFDHQTKIVRKTFICTVLRLLYDFLSLKNDVNVPSKRKRQKKLETKIISLASWRSLTKRAESEAGSVRQKYGSADPDPYQNVTDPVGEK